MQAQWGRGRAQWVSLPWVLEEDLGLWRRVFAVPDLVQQSPCTEGKLRPRAENDLAHDELSPSLV